MLATPSVETLYNAHRGAARALILYILSELFSITIDPGLERRSPSSSWAY